MLLPATPAVNTLPRILKFLIAPHVVVWSAVIASCAIPFVFEPQELFIKNPVNDKIETVYLQGVGVHSVQRQSLWSGQQMSGVAANEK